MSWGKAIPAWHAAAFQLCTSLESSSSIRLQAALDLLIHLNDTFALDGGSPPSYGGLLWCLGWRDRPGRNGCPVPRPTSIMAQKITAGQLEARARSRRFSTAFCTDVVALESNSTAELLKKHPSSDAATSRPAKRRRVSFTGNVSVSHNAGPQQTLWHYLNRSSAAALPLVGSDHSTSVAPGFSRIGTAPTRADVQDVNILPS